MFRSHPTAFMGYLLILLVGVAAAFTSKDWFQDGIFWRNVSEMTAILVFLGIGLILQAYWPAHTIVILGAACLLAMVYKFVFM